MKVFYHSADLDGHCSGAIVKYRYPHAELHPINYGDEFPWGAIAPGEDVFMVDFSLQPFSDMLRLNALCTLHWVDHHKTAIEEAAAADFLASGSQTLVDGIGACRLTWERIYGNLSVHPAPDAVTLLAKYDVWDHTDPRTLPFQYRVRLEETDPQRNMLFWIKLLTVPGLVSSFVTEGELILRYEDAQNTKTCRAYAFETDLTAIGGTYRAIAINKGMTNSRVFDSVYDPERHHLMTTFCRLPLHKQRKGGWTVSLYSTRPDVDCGRIAKTFGGGGHTGAAGFQCHVLPFRA